MKAVGIFMAFIIILTLSFFAVGFSSGITAPDVNTSAGQQYQNLSKVTSIADTGLNSVLLIFIAAMVFAAVMFLYSTVQRR